MLCILIELFNLIYIYIYIILHLISGKLALDKNKRPVGLEYVAFSFCFCFAFLADHVMVYFSLTTSKVPWGHVLSKEENKKNLKEKISGHELKIISIKLFF